MIEFVIKYCEYLTEIQFELDVLNVEIINEFDQKFGQKLQKLTIAMKCDSIDNRENAQFINKYKTLPRFCRNLVSFKG